MKTSFPLLDNVIEAVGDFILKYISVKAIPWGPRNMVHSVC